VTTEQVLFYVFAVCTLFSAAVVVTAKSPITCAMSLVATFFFLAGIYVLLWAHTIAVLQVLVYAGAIMVLFLFVIMLLSLTDVGPAAKLTVSRIVGGAAAFVLLAALVFALFRTAPSTSGWMQNGAEVASFGSLQKVGELIYTRYLLPFEAVSLLLLAAIVGAVVVAKSRI
jgi:NADH-quinone oxidoreductase subunit J